MKKNKNSTDSEKDDERMFELIDNDNDEVQDETLLKEFFDKYYALPDDEKTKKKLHQMLEELNGQIGHWVKNPSQWEIFEKDSNLAGWLVDNLGGAVIYDCKQSLYSEAELETNPCRLARGIIEIELPSIEFDEDDDSENIKEQKKVFIKLINDAESFDITSDSNSGDLIVTVEISDVYINTIELQIDNNQQTEILKDVNNQIKIENDEEFTRNIEEELLRKASEDDEDNEDDDNEMMHDDDTDDSGSNYDTFYDKFG